ncbi:MAG: tail fiber domain-containing protein, partial [Candidatus Babeliaceae bacterium]|nr:tail fiber domain-containing protein [Candidatus Babeliaceae bacterium]
STYFTGQLYGDVVGTQTATRVAFVCGIPACDLVNAYSLVLSATSADICGTLVMRDSNCNFSANLITATVTNALLSQTALYAVTANTANFAFTSSSALNALTSLTSTNFTGQLYGDVVGTQTATRVAFVCGVPACDLVNAYSLVLSGTSADIPNTLVLRDSTGSFAATTITLTGALKLQGSNSNTVTLQAGNPTNPYTLILPTDPGTNGYVLTTNGSTQDQLTWQPVSAISTSTIALYGDVIGSATANHVAFVCGVPACDVVNAYSTVLSATSAHICSTLVMRDSNCNFSANLITATVTNALLSQTALYAVVANTANFAFTSSSALNALTSVTSTNFTGQLYGDVVGTQTATHVAFVCGVPACNLVNSYSTVLSGTSEDIPNTLVLRDSQGSFAATTITLTGALKLQGINANTITLQAATPVNSYTLELPINQGLTGQVLITNGNNPAQLQWADISSTATVGTACAIPLTVVERDSNSGFAASAITLSGDALVNYSSIGVCDTGDGFIFAPTNQNTIIGLGAGNSGLLTGSSNIALGFDALATITGGYNNIAVGISALKNISGGEFNSLVGFDESSNNIAIGAQALSNSVIDSFNIAIGTQAMENSFSANGFASVNIAVGNKALQNNTGIANIGLGFQALQNNGGFGNAALGFSALQNNTSGSNNIGLAINALLNNNSGSNNTAIGQSAFSSNVSGNNNTAIGSLANCNGDMDPQGRIALGANSSALVDNAAVIGDSAITTIYPGSNKFADLGYPGNNIFNAVHAVEYRSYDSVNNFAGLTAPAAYTSTYTLQLPVDQGLSGQVLTTDGNNPAQLTWETPADNLYGDVIGSLTANHVVFVCGIPACELARTYSTVLSATSANICSTLVMRDTNCNFSANLITATATNALLSQTALYAVTASTASFAFTASSALTALTSVSATYFTGQLYGDVVGTQTTSRVAFICGVPACTLVNSYSTILSGTSADIPLTLVLRDSTGSFATTALTLTGNTLVRYGSTISQSTPFIFAPLNQNTIIGTNANSASPLAGNNNTAYGFNALSLNSSSSLTAFGSGALRSNTSGTTNTAVGYYALNANTTGTSNLAMGYQAGRSLSTNSNNTIVGNAAFTLATGRRNTVLGSEALASAGVYNDCVAVGYQALNAYTGNSVNVAVGSGALQLADTAAQNTAVGHQALNQNLSGNNCTAIGYQALQNNTAADNTALGNIVLRANTVGLQNTAVGSRALSLNTSGSFNVAVGFQALQNGPTSSNNTAVGYNVLSDQSVGSDNTALGYSALENNRTSQLVAIGSGALNSNIIGSRNVGVGYYALNTNTSGNRNVAIGYQAGQILNNSDNTLVGSSAFAQVSGSRNSVLGSGALNAPLATVNDCVAVGYYALNASFRQQLTAVGSGALQNNTSGTLNTAVGYYALSANISGTSNIAIGYQAAQSVTTNSNNTIVGNAAFTLGSGARNTVLGSEALNTAGSYNDCVAVGYQTLANNTTDGLVAIGSRALQNNINGTNNLAIGYNALNANTTGFSNIAIGTNAGQNSTAETDNIAIGTNAMQNLAADGLYYSIAIGSNALKNATTGNLASNIAIGYKAMESDSSLGRNVAIGGNTLQQNSGSFNTAVGYYAIQNGGSFNAALGYYAMQNSGSNHNVGVGAFALQNSTGSYNVGVGNYALQNNTSGYYNTALGYYALQSNQTANNNTAIGYYALPSNIQGIQNTAVGYYALKANNTGSSNTVLGNNAAPAMQSGSNNVIIGQSAGSNCVDGNNNIFIGANDTSSSGNNNTYLGYQDTSVSESNTIRISCLVSDASKCFISGIVSVTPPGSTSNVVINSSGQLGAATPSSKRYKKDIRDLEDISTSIYALRPVTFKYKEDDVTDYGLIAEETDEVMPIITGYKDGIPETVRYEKLPIMMLNEQQKDHKRIAALEEQNNVFAQTIATLHKQIEELKAKVEKLGQ